MSTKSRPLSNKERAMKARKAASRNGAPARDSRFRTVVKSLVMVGPMCTLSRFANGLRHCSEASKAGVIALQHFGISARVVPCAVYGRDDLDGTNTVIGFTPRQLHARYSAVDAATPPFDEWFATIGRHIPPDEQAVHAVIKAEAGTEEVMIDLTLGQLRQTGMPGTEKIPLAMPLFGSGWQGFSKEPWEFVYEDTMHSQADLASWRSNLERYDAVEFAVELRSAMELALSTGLDVVKWHREMATQHPELVKAGTARLLMLPTMRA